jgi:hypothetical protein
MAKINVVTELKDFASLFIKCKEAIPQVTQSLLRAILFSDFIDNL